MNGSIFKKSALGASLLVASLCAVAATPDGPYAGGSLGVPDYQSDVNGVSGSNSGMSGKAFAGYQFNPNFALEAGVAGLGRVDSTAGTVKARSVYLDAVGTLPMTEKWSALGRLGVAHVNLDTPSGDGNGQGLKLGLGVQYALNTKVALRGEWERYQPHVFDEKSAIDQYTVGVRVAF
jgi:OOP family OmpA-OmpF porin